jgi:hypothetical protein
LDPDQIIQHLLTLGAFVGGALFAADRIRKELQHRLKLDLYNEMREPLRQASTLLDRAANTAESIARAYELRAGGVNLGVIRSDELSAAHFNASEALGDVLIIFQEFEIIFQITEDVHSRIINKTRDFHSRFGSLSTKAALFLRFPEEIEQRIGHELTPPFTSRPEDLEELKRLIADYASTCRDLSGYVYDLRREAQSILLGPLFKRELQPRRPTDPSIDVLVLRE